MAKQLVNPVERHLEKAVLGAAGLVLLGVAVKYVITSPTQVELGAEQVSPAMIDQKLAEKAAAVREAIRRAQVKEEMPQPLYADFLASLDPYKQAGLPDVLPPSLPPGPKVPIVDAPEKGAGRVDLASVKPLSGTSATHGRTEFLVADERGDQIPTPANWVTVSAVFDVKAQMQQLQRQYGANRKDVIFGSAELQRRPRHDDGTWHDEDWATVEPWYPVSIPRPPTITLREEDGQVMASQDDREAAEEFFNALRNPTLQLDLLRPLLPETRRGTPWTFPLITNRQDVLMQDDQYLYPNEPPAKNPFDRYTKEKPKAAPTVQLSPGQRIDKELKEIEQQLDSAWQNKSLNECLRAYNRAFEIWRDPQASQTQKQRANELKQRADLMEDDLKRYRGPTQAPRPAEPQGNEEREPYPIQQLWRHDARPGSVESGKAYQYRLRAVIANLLAGKPEMFRDPTDGAKIFIPGPWSDPVEVRVDPDQYYFITSEDARNHEVGVEFYRWFEGNWVRAPRRIRVGIGDKVYDQQRTPVPSNVNPAEIERPTVTYEADAVAVDLDFKRVYRERNRGSGRDGVTFGSPAQACCVVLMDAQGRLTERFVETDKHHPVKSEIKVWTPSRTD